MTVKTFQEEIIEGIPNELPVLKSYDNEYNHAPKENQYLIMMNKS